MSKVISFLPALLLGLYSLGLSAQESSAQVEISGDLMQWHKVTLTLNGPFASEHDKGTNPFTDYRMTVTFTHESGYPEYHVPGYFAADGNASETSATEGSKWRAHLSPDKPGKWTYDISFMQGSLVAVADVPWGKPFEAYNGINGEFKITETDKTGRDFRGKGRLEYVGKHHLQFKGTGEYFFKAGPDAPETFLAYKEFDGMEHQVRKIPLKRYETHIKDYNEGDPLWKGSKGKGIIGAINYLASKGLNSFSFLTYNAGGDGDNVWPFIKRNDKLHYDCSKLDQWQIVFDHAQSKGLYLHFKTQEHENDDNLVGHNAKKGVVPTALDDGDLGPERRLYYRELVARFGYALALNWNIGEENTQPTEAVKVISDWFHENDPYHHNVVIHSFPNWQNRVYTPLLGDKSKLTGASLQNEWHHVFERTLKWVKASDENGKQWVVANDEQGPANKGVPPDSGYKGYQESRAGYSMHDIRKQTLWGNLMAGGAGVEYYFGYKLPQNDLIAEDFRSRDKSWEYCAIAINFLKDHNIPFQEMKNCDELIGNTKHGKEKHCLAKDGEIYLVNLAYTQTTDIDLSSVKGKFSVKWFNPAQGGDLQDGSITTIKGGGKVSVGNAPVEGNQDWVVVLRKK